jgi:hypothetical protein
MTEIAAARWEELVSEVSFAHGDEDVFDIQDARTRARALRQYFFPKLNVLLNSGRALISEIYGAEALMHFTEAQSPKPKDGAEDTTAFDKAHLGLVGERVESGLKLKGSNGKPVQYGISHLWFEVFQRGTIGVTFYPMIYGKDSRFEKLVAKELGAFEDFFCTVCGATFTTNAVYMGLGSFSDALVPEHLRKYAFYSIGAEFPVGPENGLRRLVVTFAALFPFQKLITDLSMGNDTTIDKDLNAFQAWWDENGYEIFAPERAGIERAPSQARSRKVNWESEARVMVTGAQRFRVLDRDDFRCLACGRRGADGAILHLDHIVPRSKGGTDEDDNLQTLCSHCNIGKSNKSSRDLRAS